MPQNPRGRGYLKGVVLGKKPYEIINFTLKKRLERELESREEKETKKRFKVCLICKTRKSLSYFAVDKRSSDGRVGACKICKSRQSLAYYYEHKEEIAVKVKKYREDNPIDRSEYFQDYRRDNKERLRKIAKLWYKKNKKAIKKRSLEYYNNNREYCQFIRELWRLKNRGKLKKYNRQYNLKMRGG